MLEVALVALSLVTLLAGRQLIDAVTAAPADLGLEAAPVVAVRRQPEGLCEERRLQKRAERSRALNQWLRG